MWRDNRNGKKSSKRRNKFEIWSEILENCLKTPQTQSWLCRNLQLKTSYFKESIDFLIERELVIERKTFEKVEYLTSKKGEETLIQYYILINNFFKLNKD